MALSPLDIRNKTFATKMRGFNPNEVDDFLDQVISDYEEVIRQKRDLEKSLKHAEEKLTYFNELKDALNQSIIVAQDTADKLKENATKEATIILSTAEAQAKEIVTSANEESKITINNATVSANTLLNDATSKARQLAVETDDLKKKTRTFHRNLSMILDSQIEIVKSDEWEDLLKPFSSYVNEDHSVVQEVLSKELDNGNRPDVSFEEGTTKAIEVNEINAAIEAAEATTTVVFPTDEETK